MTEQQNDKVTTISLLSMHAEG